MSPSAGIESRQAAIELLNAILTEKKTIDSAIMVSTKFRELSGPDRAFAMLLTNTCLRHLGVIDLLIDEFLRKPLPTNALQVRQSLRIGVAQLHFLGTPPHAAVDTSVAIVRRTQYSGFKGLVNAVLRRIAVTKSHRRDYTHLINTPDWLQRSWQLEYGREIAARIAESHCVEPPLDITLKSSSSIRQSMPVGDRLPTGSIRLNSAKNISSLPGYEKGDWWVQDAAAALPAQLIKNPGGKHIIDLCAAPGGKSAQLASAGANLTAVDKSEKKLKIFKINFSRLKLFAQIVRADIEFWRPKRLADAVLLDPPCTGTGTIRRHPEVVYLKHREDVSRLARTQLKLLQAASEMVRPGGHLIYAVCSLQPEEGPQVIEKFLFQNRKFRIDPIQINEAKIPVEFIAENGTLRTLPCHWQDYGGLDGFFAARFLNLDESL